MPNVKLLTTAAIATALALPAFAQTEISAGADAAGVSAIDDRLIDVEDAVRDDFRRDADADRFGPADRRQGLFGSMALTYSGRTGNTENQDLAIAGRVSYNQGPWAQSVGLLIEFGEDDDGFKDQEEVSAIYDAQYYFDDRFYAFALGRFTVNGLVDGEPNRPEADPTSELSDLRRDGFLGVGPGYRIINNETTTWRVQAGIGMRYTQTGQQYINDDSETEMGYIASSRVYHRFNDMIFVTNDTDYLGSSDADDVITNELGVNFRMTDALATRVSYRTEYQENRAIRTDNKLGLSIVYGF